MFQFLKSTAALIAAALLVPLVAAQGVTPPPGFNMYAQIDDLPKIWLWAKLFVLAQAWG